MEREPDGTSVKSISFVALRDVNKSMVAYSYFVIISEFNYYGLVMFHE